MQSYPYCGCQLDSAVFRAQVEYNIFLLAAPECLARFWSTWQTFKEYQRLKDSNHSWIKLEYRKANTISITEKAGVKVLCLVEFVEPDGAWADFRSTKLSKLLTLMDMSTCTRRSESPTWRPAASSCVCIQNHRKVKVLECRNSRNPERKKSNDAVIGCVSVKLSLCFCKTKIKALQRMNRPRRRCWGSNTPVSGQHLPLQPCKTPVSL